MKSEIARDLLNIEAVQINTKEYFTWTSGIKSPIYCDNRLTISYPEIRKKIMAAFVEKIKAMDEQPDVIAGCATAGIPHAAWLAHELDLPLVYVRSTPKGHGQGNQIEGHLEAGQRAIVIEDLISTGGSAIEAAKALEEAGGIITSVLAIFTYGLDKANHQFEEAGFPYSTITNYDEIVNVLNESGQITDDEKQELRLWRDEL